MDGFDLYANNTDMLTRWDTADSSVTFGSAFGRFGGGAVKITDDDRYLHIAVPGTPQTAIISFALFRTSTTPGSDFVMKFDTSASSGGITIKSTGSGGTLEVFRGVLTSLGTFVISSNTWHWVSIKYKAANTGGTIDIEVGGVNVFSFTGDTVQSGTETVNNVRLGADVVQDFSYDDVIICDDAGSAPFNDLLTDRRIDTLLPNAAGDSAGFTASPAVANHLNVDDATPDGDTTHVESNVSTTKDLYNMASMSFSPGSIDGVNVVAQVRNPDAGTPGVKLKVKHSTSEGTGASQAATTNYKYIDELFLLNPSTSLAWTESEVNAMQAGQEIT